MASKKFPLKIVLSKFPERAVLIEELFAVSESFRSLCQDYADCLKVIKDLDCSKQMIQKGYEKEYEELLHELEQELITKLDEKKTGQGNVHNKSP